MKIIDNEINNEKTADAEADAAAAADDDHVNYVCQGA